MMGLESAWVVLLAEAWLVTLLCIVGWLVSRRRRHAREHEAIQRFIDELENSAMLGNKPLKDWLNAECGLERNKISDFLSEVNEAERALYQRIIELILTREMNLLQDIDQSIAHLADPYFRLLENLHAQQQQASPSLPASTANRQNESIDVLLFANQQLRQQLATALQTIDEMTEEYARVFTGQQTALDLQNSSKNMLNIFQQAQQNVTRNLSDEDKS